MFNIYDMINSYKERLVENTRINDAIIDTCRVMDAEKPYETAIKHPSYNNNEWIIVQEYDTIEEAKKGHREWVLKFTNSLPDKLIDVSTSTIAKLDSFFRINRKTSFNRN